MTIKTLYRKENIFIKLVSISVNQWFLLSHTHEHRAHRVFEFNYTEKAAPIRNPNLRHKKALKTQGSHFLTALTNPIKTRFHDIFNWPNSMLNIQTLTLPKPHRAGQIVILIFRLTD